jgi:chitinase
MGSIDIDYEDDSGFTGGYDGIDFLSTLTSELAQALPPGQSIITHAPQTPYWDTKYHKAPYAQIWQQVGNQITWINNQFYHNSRYDRDAFTKIQWYNTIANTMGGAQQLLVGALLEPGADGYLPVDQMINDVINPLQNSYGTQFGGVMAWEWSLDVNWAWSNAIAPSASPAKARDQRGSWRVKDLLVANIIRTKLGSQRRPRVRVLR